MNDLDKIMELHNAKLAFEEALLVLIKLRIQRKQIKIDNWIKKNSDDSGDYDVGEMVGIYILPDIYDDIREAFHASIDSEYSEAIYEIVDKGIKED